MFEIHAKLDEGIENDKHDNHEFVTENTHVNAKFSITRKCDTLYRAGLLGIVAF
jgi:low affinity Fe/Cu permease